MKRLLIPTLILAVVLGLGIGALAWADRKAADTLAEETRVGGIEVSGLTKDEALVRLRRRVGMQIGRPTRVRVAGRTYTLGAARAGVKVDLATAVNRANDAGRGGNLLTRGWRELTDGDIRHDEPVPVKADRRKVQAFVSGIHASLARKPVDATLEMAVESISVSEGKAGRRLAGRDDLVDRIHRALQRRAGGRTFRARLASVAPKVTEDEVLDATPMVVTVSRRGKTVRLFERGKLVKSYRVAVGQPKYPTPTGRFAVQVMQKNPPWNVPQSEWAGDLAGKTIPAGDPRNPIVSRWIGFSGSVGFHGTKSVDSLGTAASHGCVRMRVGDIQELFERIRTGTPVLVA